MLEKLQMANKYIIVKAIVLCNTRRHVKGQDKSDHRQHNLEVTTTKKKWLT